ncbi:MULTISPECIES: diguanylate cyclase [Pseudanabaena]|uniref:Diguanylate cyclase n=2 Tax=Pseudanabaena TaxID=1152 RepID=L8N749_9CYAN|nr:MULTISPECIES: diguanylate cyclase [Pseudanabaena]ELS34058.1 diguanylate cyclase [Pseudanabaena biceps PCC 7429]MDG3493721.1 GGDEF domain-containing protein [Pseudanabaena catenata USMAC16]
METEKSDLVSTEGLFLATVASLKQEIQELKAQNIILRDRLVSKTIQEEQLSEANHRLQTEIIDRQRTETALRLLLDRLSSEKNDLEIILDTTTRHSDTIEALLYERALSLAREVTIDGLTQIANRRTFDQKLEIEWQRLAREGLPMSLLICDVDFFKRYNDRYGHPAGDDCLRAVAKAIESCIRRPADLAARYGGEEFAVILPNTLKEGATFIAEKVCHTVSSLNIKHEASFISDRVTVSIGISTIQPTKKLSSKILIESADKGLYLAKKQGRDRAVFNAD